MPGSQQDTASCRLDHHSEQHHTQQQHPWLCRRSSSKAGIKLGSCNSSSCAQKPWLQGTTTCNRHPPVALSAGTTAAAQTEIRSMHFHGTPVFRGFQAHLLQQQSTGSCGQLCRMLLSCLALLLPKACSNTIYCYVDNQLMNQRTPRQWKPFCAPLRVVTSSSQMQGSGLSSVRMICCTSCAC